MYLAMSFTGLSLVLLFIGSDCLPIQKRSDSSQQPAWCRDHRPKSSLASPCNEDEKVRRYFLHESNPKGCKKFGICPNAAAKYDNQPENNYFLSFQECQRECMEHVQCPALPIGENMAVVSDNALQGWGRRVVFECNNGYSLSDNSDRNVRTCQKNGTWSGGPPVCLKQCEAPLTVRHAHIAPSKELHSQGGTVHYTCEIGYMLNGSAQRTCGANGDWIEEEPSCHCRGQVSETEECTRCSEPSPIEHGQLHAPYRSLFAEIEYTCDPSFTMFGSPTRVCGENGEWSGDQPTCFKMKIVTETGVDITDTVVEVATGSSNIKFTAISSTPNPFKDATPEWTFREEEGLPFGVQQSELSLTFDSILQTKEQRGNYSIILGNYTTSFQLDIKEEDPPLPEVPPQDTRPPQLVILLNSVIGGEVAEFMCVVSGHPIPTLQWYRDEQLLTSGGRTVVESPGSQMSIAVSRLIISNVTESDSGSYWCRAENAGGNGSWVAELNVARTVQKRSIDDSAKSSLCNTESSNTVTLLGRVKAHRRARDSDGMPAYRVQVRRFLRGSEAESNLHRVRALVVDGEEEILRTDTDYIFQGRLIDKTLFVSRHGLYRHTSELESHIASSSLC